MIRVEERCCFLCLYHEPATTPPQPFTPFSTGDARVAPPLPHHLVCVEKFTLPYLTLPQRLGHEPRLDQAPDRAEKRQADAVGQILRLLSHLRQNCAGDRHRHEEEEVVEQEAVEQGLVGHLCQDVVALCGWCTQEPPRLCYLRDHARHRDLVRRHR